LDGVFTELSTTNAKFPHQCSPALGFHKLNSVQNFFAAVENMEKAVIYVSKACPTHSSGLNSTPKY
jgi:hypothetical protein